MAHYEAPILITVAYLKSSRLKRPALKLRDLKVEYNGLGYELRRSRLRIFCVVDNDNSLELWTRRPDFSSTHQLPS